MAVEGLLQDIVQETTGTPLRPIPKFYGIAIQVPGRSGDNGCAAARLYYLSAWL